MKSAIDLVRELYYWFYIGTADDIVSMPVQRPEYQHLVKLCKDAKIKPDEIPTMVLSLLVQEMRKPKIFQGTFWRILLFDIRRFIYGF